MSRIWVVDDDEEMLNAVRLILVVLDHEAGALFGARPVVRALLEAALPTLCSSILICPK